LNGLIRSDTFRFSSGLLFAVSWCKLITPRGEIFSPLLFVHLTDSLSQQIHLGQLGDSHQGLGSVETMGSSVAIHAQSHGQEVTGAVA
jgi:hypothetical protein